MIEDLRRLFATLPKPGNAYVWAGLTGLLCDFLVPELAPEARQIFAEGLVDESILDLPWLEKSRFVHGEKNLAYFRERNVPLDAIAECSGWRCFRDENEDAGPWDDAEGIDQNDLPDDALGLPPEELYDIPAPTPYLAPPKIGRNDPCPCGSGKKYKKCCGK